MELPLVSVLMTSYNRQKYIGEAIESVLASSYTNFELIIVDDCSKDETVKIANAYSNRDPRVKVFVNEKNLGDYLNRNRAAELAKGKYIKYLDSDDLIYYYALDVMVNYMERFPEAGFGLSSIPDFKPFPIFISPLEIYRENFYGFNHFDRSPGSSIIKLDVFRKLGGFSGRRMIGDYEFWFKIARYHSLVKLPFELYWYRWSHGEQETSAEYAKEYPILKEQVLEEGLNHSDCPLDIAEIKKIRAILKQHKRKNGILGVLSKINKIVFK